MIRFDQVERFRLVRHPYAPSNPGDRYGLFYIPSGNKHVLEVIANEGHAISGGWEHVSAKRALVKNPKHTALPSWTEMCRLKDLFWPPEDLVVQFHPPKADYINRHPHVLHLWRHPDQQIQLPPPELV